MIITIVMIIIIRAFRLATLAVGLFAATPQAGANGAHGRGQELPPVALPLPVPQSPRLCGVFAPIPGANILYRFQKNVPKQKNKKEEKVKK